MYAKMTAYEFMRAVDSRVAEGGDLGLDSADGREAVGAVPGRTLQPQRAIGIVAHVILVYARHRRAYIMPEHPRLRTFPCMHANTAGDAHHTLI